ncbi:MAG: hypothetical protein AAGA27_07440 [Pseudomonadota bacterium]
MSNTALAFDTLRYAKRLREVGVPEEQAEIQAEAIQEPIGEQLATKLDLKDVGEHTKFKIEQLRLEIKQLEKSTKIEIKQLEKNTKTEIKQSEERLLTRINELNYKLTIRLGSLIVVGVFVLAALIKF